VVWSEESPAVHFYFAFVHDYPVPKAIVLKVAAEVWKVTVEV
jgi:hypothetical protein